MKSPLLELGAISVHAVPEVTVSYDPNFLFHALPPDFVRSQTANLPGWSFENGGERINLTFQSLLVRHAGRVILVDACNGNHKDRRLPRWHQRDFPYLEALADAGVAPEEVDTVLCTHLHADHVGWNTRLEDGNWVPTFPNARYLTSKEELAYWKSSAADNPSSEHEAWNDSVLPIIDAGLLDAVDSDETLSSDSTATLALQPAAGHTPGHVHLSMRSHGLEAICCADTLHHPLQVSHPHFSLTDHDHLQALETRRNLIAHCADSGAIVVPSHFAMAGTISRAGSSHRFVPLGER